MTQKPVPTVYDHSVPWFWPLAAAVEMGEAGLHMFEANMRYLDEAGAIVTPPSPKWATGNKIFLDLDAMRVREFTAGGT